MLDQRDREGKVSIRLTSRIPEKGVERLRNLPDVFEFQSVSLHGFQRKFVTLQKTASVTPVSIRLTSRIPEKAAYTAEQFERMIAFQSVSLHGFQRKRGCLSETPRFTKFQSVSLHGFQRKFSSLLRRLNWCCSFNPSHFTDSRERRSGTWMHRVLALFQSVSLHGFQRKTNPSPPADARSLFQSVSLHGFQRKLPAVGGLRNLSQVSIRLTSRIPEKATAQLWAGSRVWVSIRLTSRIPEKVASERAARFSSACFNPSHFTDSRESRLGA